jgi:hypothetical protein
MICYDDTARIFAANGFYPEPDESSYIIPLQFFKMHFNVKPLPIPRPFSDQNFVCISHLSHECYMIHPLHPICVDYHNNVWLRVHIMTLLIMQCFLTLVTQYTAETFPSNPVLKHLQSYDTIFYTCSS